MAQSRTFAQQAYRVLAVAMRDIEQGVEKLDIDQVEQNLTFLGLVAMIDPPRHEVPEAIARCRQAGVRTIMITGDHPLTALAIARQIGLAPKESLAEPDGDCPAIEGHQVETMSDETLRRLLTPTRPGKAEPIFARMAPRHKMRVVSVLKDMGEVVAVTGDGVNDAPAIKKADIGIAMGIAGTDVAKETADMILLDDNFATIVNAIEEGRAVYANIRKFSTYVLASNVPEVVPYLAYGLFGIPLALTVPQILAVDLGTDMVPALALGAEKPDAGIMSIPPRPRTERLMNLPLLLRAYVFLGLIEAGIAMGAFFLIAPDTGMDLGHAARLVRPALQTGDRRHLRRHRRRPGGERVRLPLRPTVALSTRLVQQSIAPLGNRDRTRRPGLHHLYPLGQRDLWNQPLACLDLRATRAGRPCAVIRRGKP